jgi:RNA polymerase sigma factor (sigma-70 family)
MATGQLSGVLHHLRRSAFLADGGGMTDAQLLDSFLTRQDEAAFEALVRRHGPMVLGVCRRVLRHAHDAEDACQATFLILARKAATLEQPELLGNWLYGVAYRTARDAKAAAVRRRRREGPGGELPEPEAPVAEEWDDLRPVLDQELSRLPEKYRLAVVLCDLEGRARREVARELGIPEGTLSGRLTTARRKLAQRLARRGLTLSGGALAAILSPGSASACVPGPLVVSTVGAATRLAAGEAATKFVSATVAALMRGSRFMRTCKLGGFFAFLVLGVVLAISTETPLPRTSAQPTPEKKTEPRKEVWKSAGTLDGHENPVLCLTFGPDHVLVASDEGPQVRVWDAATKKELPFYKITDTPKERAVTGITYAADNTWVSFREKNAIHMASGDYLKGGIPTDYGIGFGGGHVVPLALASDGKTYAFRQGNTNTVAVVDWDLKNRGQEKTTATCKGHQDELLCAAFSPDGALLVTGSADKTARVWEVASGNEKHTLLGHTEGISVVAFSPDGKRIATGGKDGLVKLWDASTGKEQSSSLKGHTVVCCLTFSPDGKTLVSGGEDQKVRIWDVGAGKETAILGDHKDTVLAVAFSRDGGLLATAGHDKTIRLWKKSK